MDDAIKMGLSVILCVAVAIYGAWSSAQCRHQRGKLPEDIQ